jgi:hypothetical protein
VHRTPFDKLPVAPKPTDRQKYEAARRGSPAPVPFNEGLDVFWRGIDGDEPVLTLNWNAQRVKVWRYQPGRWEEELERLAGK